jgi:hypothetical protein
MVSDGSGAARRIKPVPPGGGGLLKGARYGSIACSESFKTSIHLKKIKLERKTRPANDHFGLNTNPE